MEIYRIGELPAILKTALPAVVRALAAEELAGKQYDKTQKHETEKYIDLPAPTLKDPKRMKRRQVLGITEEYRIQAELDGQADIRIPAMLLLANYAEGGPGLILLAVDASLPVRGRVQCKVPDVASVSTGYRITVQLSAVAEVAARHEGNDVTLARPSTAICTYRSLDWSFPTTCWRPCGGKSGILSTTSWRTTRSVSAKARTMRAKGDVFTRGPHPAPRILAAVVNSAAAGLLAAALWCRRLACTSGAGETPAPQ